MLEISPAVADALEAQLLARWKMEICSAIRQRCPDETRQMEEATLASWVRQAMETARQIGGTSKAELQDFALALFIISEARRDQAQSGDFAAMMGAENDFGAKIAMMRKAFVL